MTFSSALPKPAGTWGEALRPMASGAAAAYPRLPRPPGGTCTRPQMRVSAMAARAPPRVPASGLVGVVAPALAVAPQRAPVAA